jgi:hypothetical protein
MERIPYFKIWLIDTPKEERRKFDIGDIFINKAKCLLCNHVIVSEHRHDYVPCECGNLAVDGGSWYLRRCFKEEDSYEELSEYYTDKGEKDEKKN